MLDGGPRTLKTGRRARVNQARHRFELMHEGRRYRAEVLCRPADVAEPQIVAVEDPAP